MQQARRSPKGDRLACRFGACGLEFDTRLQEERVDAVVEILESLVLHAESEAEAFPVEADAVRSVHATLVTVDLRREHSTVSEVDRDVGRGLK